MTKAELLQKADSLPLLPGVYLMMDKTGLVIYVGKAKKLKNRVSQYFQADGGHNPKTKAMIEIVDRFDTIVVRSEFEALVLENSLIKRHQPRYNTLLKDDKGYPFLRLDKDAAYPRFSMVSKYAEDGAEYFGPFGGRSETRQALESVLALLKLPTCRRQFPRDIGKERPCLMHHIGKCDGWCIAGRLTAEEYHARIQQAVQLLRGKMAPLRRQLTEQMNEAAEEMAFERAAALRDRLRALAVLSKQQQVIAGLCADTDVWGVFVGPVRCGAAVLHIEDGDLLGREVEVFPTGAEDDVGSLLDAVLCQYYLGRSSQPHEILVPALWDDAPVMAELLTQDCGHKVTVRMPQRGEKAELVRMAADNAKEECERITSEAERTAKTLSALQELAALQSVPRRIESYDISHTGGEDMVASMVVFDNGKPRKGDYRKFTIKTLDHADDTAALSEVLRRRFRRYLDGDEKFAPLPDLLLMDGGIGQAHAAQAVIRDLGLNVPILGMVKDDRHRTRALVTVDGEELGLQHAPHLFAFVGRVQEEVHRAAITYHHKKHRKSAYRSKLDGIPGVGEARKKALLKHFGTVKAVAEADLSALQAALPQNAAKAVWERFHKE